VILLGFVLMVLGFFAFARVSPEWFQSQTFLAKVAAELSPALRVPVEAAGSYRTVSVGAMTGGALVFLVGFVDRMRGAFPSRRLTHAVLNVIALALATVVVIRWVGARVESGTLYPGKIRSVSGTAAPVPTEVTAARTRLLDEGAGGLEDLKNRAWTYKKENHSWRGITTENLWQTLKFNEPPSSCWTYGVGRTSDGGPTTATGWQAAIELVAWARPTAAPRCGALSTTDMITVTLRGDGTSSRRGP
jgi:hypothetical protein